MKHLTDEMKKIKKRGMAVFIMGLSPILYHIFLLGISAALALSLPWTIRFIADKFLAYWSFVGNDKIFFISLEMALAILFLFVTASLRKSWKDRKFSRMAKAAGLVSVIPSTGFLAKRRIRKQREKQGHASDVMVISPTGFHTFVDPEGDLHQLIRNCREARIMLLNPNRQGITVSAKTIPGSEMTPEKVGEQFQKSIDFLKSLKAAQKNIKLKLYPDPPFWKMAILDDYIWLQDCQPGFNGPMAPQYVFKHAPDTGSLYFPFYHYFMVRWNNPEIPEYDLGTDQLIYRNPAGNEVRREKLGTMNNKGLTQRTLLGKETFDDGNRVKNGASSHLQTLVGRTPADDFPVALRQNLHGGLHPGGKQFTMLRSRNPICEAADWIIL